MRVFFILLISMCIIACSEKSIEFEMTGTRIVKIHPNINKFRIIDNKRVDTIEFTKFKELKFISPLLNNSKDCFYIQVYWKNTELNSYNHQIIKCDLKGEILDTIFIAKKNEDITSSMLSPDNDFLVVRSNNYHEWKNSVGSGIDQFSSLPDTTKHEIEYKIINLSNKQIDKSFTIKSNFSQPDLHENSLSPNSDMIILTRKTKIQYKFGDTEELLIYNLKNDSITQIGKGYFAAWSPILENKIIYLNDKDVCLYDVVESTKEKIFTLNENEKFENIRWTPDGKYIFVNVWEWRFLNRIIGDAIIYPLKASGKIIDIQGISKFEDINGHYNIETWKY